MFFHEFLDLSFFEGAPPENEKNMFAAKLVLKKLSFVNVGVSLKDIQATITYPTFGEGKSSSYPPLGGDMLVSRRVYT